MEKFAVFELMVMKEALLNKSICLLWCPDIN
jgi:Pyruvate/2-oxoacid:ferredoxin oxidoreductase delta subunit